MEGRENYKDGNRDHTLCPGGSEFGMERGVMLRRVFAGA